MREKKNKRSAGGSHDSWLSFSCKKRLQRRRQKEKMERGKQDIEIRPKNAKKIKKYHRQPHDPIRERFCNQADPIKIILPTLHYLPIWINSRAVGASMYKPKDPKPKTSDIGSARET